MMRTIAHLLGVVAVYAGFIAILVGVAACLTPLPLVGFHSRAQAAVLLGIGLALLLLGWFLPTGETRVETMRTRLDEFVPVYQFSEFHSIRIAASEEKCYAAIKAVTSGEIFLFRTFTWIRRFGRPSKEGILNAPMQESILDVATRTTFLLLAEEATREIAIGTVLLAPPGSKLKTRPTPDEFKALQEPGFAVGAVNFLITEETPGTMIVTTETRVYATAPSTRRRFTSYWRTIYPGSSLLRYTWLSAIKRRAESHS